MSEFWLSAIGLAEVRGQRLAAGVDPHPLQGSVAGIDTRRGGAAGLGRLGRCLGEGAAGHRGIGRLGRGARRPLGRRPPNSAGLFG